MLIYNHYWVFNVVGFIYFSMGPCIIHKIADLLDIENCDTSSREDLSCNILNFLMEKKSAGINLNILLYSYAFYSLFLSLIFQVYI